VALDEYVRELTRQLEAGEMDPARA
jgi:hypothetical protein